MRSQRLFNALCVVRWQDISVLGDEVGARSRKFADGDRNTHQQRAESYQAAARAYRRLAVALQTNGMIDEADTYRYRAQLMQRRFYWHNRRLGRWFFSALLALLAGYGYKPARSFLTYVLVIAVFTGLFLLAGVGDITFGLTPTEYHQLPWYEALVLSVASFHGRGFFQPVQSPGDPIAILAASRRSLASSSRSPSSPPSRKGSLASWGKSTARRMGSLTTPGPS
jgi:hypothetical protein